MIEREDEAAALFALLQARNKNAGWGTIAAHVSAANSAKEVLYGSEDALFANPDTGAMIDRAARQLRSWLDRGYRLTTVLERDYPRRLRDIREMPPFLFYEGHLRIDDDGMSVVGSRRASERGKAVARATSELLVDEGMTVIAGLAEGIDTAAHRAALDAGGRTAAFIGTGITRRFPASNAKLQEEIAERGLVLSQFFPDAPPTKSTFPMRNVCMSGYGLATIVIEAGEKSGSRIQARVAGKHGRPVVLTTSVVDSTGWGRALVGSPNVYVVGSMNEMRDAVRTVRQSPGRLDDALAALIAS